jgi:hypothetical protein
MTHRRTLVCLIYVSLLCVHERFLTITRPENGRPAVYRDIQRGTALEGKEELFSARTRACVHPHARRHALSVRAQPVGYAETHVQGYPARSRSRRPVSDNRHHSSNDPPAHVRAHARMSLHAEGWIGRGGGGGAEGVEGKNGDTVHPAILVERTSAERQIRKQRTPYSYSAPSLRTELALDPSRGRESVGEEGRGGGERFITQRISTSCKGDGKETKGMKNISPKAETRETDPHDEEQVFSWLKSDTTQRRSSWTAGQHS